VIIPDVNLLLYASIRTFEVHDAAHDWFTAVLNGDAQLLLPAVTVFGFVRIASNPRVFDSPIAVGDALAAVESWLELLHVHFLAPGPRFIDGPGLPSPAARSC
jgi:toxin-antitoxin system PIN domain toxin